MESNVKRATLLGTFALAVAALLAADLADARRLSGGRSLGAQRPAAQPAPPAASPAGASTSNAAAATPPGAGPASNPVMAPPAGGPAARPAAAAGAAGQAAKPASRWLGPVAGLAAGLGLAALAAHLGFSEELASLLLVVLLAVAAIALLRFAFARRAPGRVAMPYAGAGAGLGTTPGGYETQVPPRARTDPAFGGVPPMNLSAGRRVPAGFDAAGFAREARRQFLAVQAAHDRQDAKALADVMAPELLREIQREMDLSGAARPTEIVDVDAEVVDVATEGRNHWVSVRFSGTAREGGVLEPFDEIWNLTKPVDGNAGWRVAGIQQQVTPS